MPPPVTKKRIPTKRRMLLLGKLLENPGISLYKAMTSVGYSHNTASEPRKNLKGFQELLDEHLPDSFLLSALEDDIKNKKGNRKGEIELALKVKGRLKSDDNTTNTNTSYTQVNINDSSPRGEAMVKSFAEYMLNKTLPEGSSEKT